MKRPPLALAGLATLLAAVLGAPAVAHEEPKPLHARAIVSGPNGIQGIVTFRQRACPGCGIDDPTVPATDPGFRHFPEPTVEVTALVSGPPGVLAPGAHGVHIHEVGLCDANAGFTTAGGHFDPGPFGQSHPDANHPFHMGDLPNLMVNSRGRGTMKHTTSRITLSPGPLGVFDGNGSAVIIHAGPDRGITGLAGASGGARIACGVIEPTPPHEVDDD